LDGVDAALVKIKGNGANSKFDLIEFNFFPFPDGLSNLLLKVSLPGKGSVDEICKLNFIIPYIYFDAIKALLAKAKFPLKKLDLIGSHGQTIHHLPKIESRFGYSTGSTLQIGDPAVLAKLSNTVTIGDFRTGDMALGGQGAPLVPYFDFLFFRSQKKNRALLNIGGISNFTILPKDCSKSHVIAWDTGPGNMLSDFLCQRFINLPYDKDGQIALNGIPDKVLFNKLVKKDRFIELPPPKSTGREFYNMNFLKPALLSSKLSQQDIIATVAQLTPYSVFRNYELFVKNKTALDELIVSGGGSKNKFFIHELKKYFGKNVKVKKIDEYGIISDAKEAVCFAVLANETVSGNTTNIPGVTGASRKTILGKICLP